MHLARLANRANQTAFAPHTPQVSVLETARVQAVMWDGGSEDQLFYGAAGQFVDRLAAVRCGACSLVCASTSRRQCSRITKHHGGVVFQC